MKINITDEATRECLACYIIVRRLGFDPRTEIGLMVNDSGQMSVVVRRNNITFAMVVGTTLMTGCNAHTTWDSWAKAIHDGEVSTAAIQDFLSTSKVYKHAVEEITRSLMSKGMIDAATIQSAFKKPANQEQAK